MDIKYLVTWEIEFEHDDEDVRSPLEAARKALQIQRNPKSIATVFDVTDKDTGETVQIDLEEFDNP